MTNNILVINAHPRVDSFCSALAQSYIEGATAAGCEVRSANLRELRFNQTFAGYGQGQALESDLATLQQDILWADHLTLVYPLWWGSMPGLLKSTLDRVLLPGFAFRYQSRWLPPQQLLKGKTARLLVTMDSPPPVYRYLFGAPGHRQMKQVILGFCGVKTIGETDFGPVKLAPAPLRQAWLAQARVLGQQEGQPVWQRALAPLQFIAATSQARKSGADAPA